MLKELQVKNFALIDDAKIVFKKGLNILTGETGAGKTLIIEAINLLIGERADSELIKDGAESLLVQGFFDFSENKRVAEFLKNEQLIASDDTYDETVITREVNRKGKNRTFVNGIYTQVANLKRVGRLFIDIHGQHEHQYLLDPSTHIDIVDWLGKEDIEIPLNNYQDYLKKYKSALKEIESIKEQVLKKDEAIANLKYRLNEIEKLDFTENEDVELENQKNILKNSENIFKYSNECVNLLDGKENDYSLIDNLLLFEKNIRELSIIDKDLVKFSEDLSNFNILLAEISIYLKNYLDDFDFNIQRLESVQERLFALNELKRKYSLGLKEILDQKESLKEDLSKFEKIDDNLEDKIAQLQSIENKLVQSAKTLSSIREKTIKIFEEKIINELKELKFKYVDFKAFNKSNKDTENIDDISKIRFNKNGIDDIEFMISLNMGESAKPLVRISSGGEISRVMLAIKSIISVIDNISVLVFDEIDSGIGGEAAVVVGQKLYKISLNKQVLCITHLAQIACFADSHYYIDKYFENDKTKIRITELGKEQRFKEISRMLSGNKESDISLMHSKDMIAQCGIIKEKITEEI
jgi:DNA repair protein RecN (Recombination protein N)